MRLVDISGADARPPATAAGTACSRGARRDCSRSKATYLTSSSSSVRGLSRSSPAGTTRVPWPLLARSGGGATTNWGQQGDGTTTNSPVPVRVVGLGGPAAGAHHPRRSAAHCARQRPTVGPAVRAGTPTLAPTPAAVDR